MVSLNLGNSCLLIPVVSKQTPYRLFMFVVWSNSPRTWLKKLHAATPLFAPAPFPSVGRMLFHASYGFIALITLIPLLIVPVECKVQPGWEFITLRPWLIFPLNVEFNGWWEFISPRLLLIFPIECKVQRGCDL